MTLQLNTNTSQTGRPKGSSVLERFESSAMPTLPPVLTLALPRVPAQDYIRGDVLVSHAAYLDPPDVDPIPAPLLGHCRDSSELAKRAYRLARTLSNTVRAIFTSC